MNYRKIAVFLAVLSVTSLLGNDFAFAKNVKIQQERISIQETTEQTKQKKNIKEDIVLSAGVAQILDRSLADTTSVTMKELSTGKQASVVTMVKKDTANQENWGYTNLGIANVDNHLNIRQEPSESGKLVGKLNKNAACEVLSVENGWAHIKSGKVEGYCSAEYLYTGNAAVNKAKEVASLIAVVDTETLKVREEPNTDCAVITLIPREEELEVIEIMNNGWIKFQLDDEEAYVSGEYVKVEERLEKAATMTELMYGQGVSDVRVDLVQYAKQFIGNPYVWGGTSLTKGVDCSGFTMQVYKKYGINLPHYSVSQAQMGTKVTLNEAKPGDLVFYAKNGTINHVAIYIGGGQVVHASNPKSGIKISNINYRTPETIRRYIND